MGDLMIRCILILLFAINMTYPPVGDGACGVSGQIPLVFPNAMPPAAQMISDVLSEELSWRADIFNFLNNSTNLTNQTHPMIA